MPIQTITVKQSTDIVQSSTETDLDLWLRSSD